MKTANQPVTLTIPNETSTKFKRTLFHMTLTISMIITISISTILLLQGGLDFGYHRYFIDIGQYSLFITSILLIIFGLISLLTFIILTLGLIKVRRNYVIVATILLILCSFSLIIFSIYSYGTLASGRIANSINRTLIKELDETKYNIISGQNYIVDNTVKMAQLEKQHKCCGFIDPIDDYRSRQASSIESSLPTSANSKVRTGHSQKSSTILLPLSCCNAKYRSNENNLCIDSYGTTSNPINRYNIDGCYNIILRNKSQRIKQQGFITIITSCLSVISCITLAALIRLLGEGYQIVPLRTAT